MLAGGSTAAAATRIDSVTAGGGAGSSGGCSPGDRLPERAVASRGAPLVAAAASVGGARRGIDGHTEADLDSEVACRSGWSAAAAAAAMLT